MDIVKHTPWQVPLILVGMVGGVTLLHQSAQVEIGSNREDRRAEPKERRTKDKPPPSATLSRKDDQPSSSRNKEAPAKNKIDAVKNKGGMIFVFGTVTYDDAFKAGRTTSFLLFYSDKNISSADSTLNICDEGNYMG